MSLQPALQPRSSVNGYSRRRAEKDVGGRVENKYQPGQSNPSRVTGFPSGNKSDSRSGSPGRDRLVYLTTCLIGHQVDVQVKNGSIYSGILHASNAEMDFGIVLKMAQLTKDTSGRGLGAASESVNKSPSKTLIIPAHELVQVVAKDVPVTRDGINSELALEKQDLFLDSYISKSRQVDGERELKPWVPDEDAPHNADLDNTFNSRWTGSWDQFRVNEQLFGVKSTFNEELYTTKLERGPQTRELEQEALRIAREIECEETDDLHLAEERGIYSHLNIDVDEETRYSSVFRQVDDSGYDEDEDPGFDTRNTDTFGESSDLVMGGSYTDVDSSRADDGDNILSSTSSLQTIDREPSYSGSLAWEGDARCSHAVEADVRYHQEGGENIDHSNDSLRTEVLMEEHRNTTAEGSVVSLERKDCTVGKVVLPKATADSNASGQEKAGSSGELPEDATSSKVQGAAEPKSYRVRSSSSASATADGRGGPSPLMGPALSPSSSVGSLSSEKSTLNPNAKEFKLNPNARSFVPSQGAVRPMPPVAESSFYYPANVPAVSHIPGMPVGYGIGPALSGPQQQMMFNHQGAPMQAPQTYYPANQPQFGQQMMIGHPRQVMYMPTFPSMGVQQEMPYTKGRDF